MWSFQNFEFKTTNFVLEISGVVYITHRYCWQQINTTKMIFGDVHFSIDVLIKKHLYKWFPR
jgi:hypothetical protein